MILAIFLLLAVPTTPPPAANAIQCTGVWSPATTEQALIAQFGRANVKRANVYLAEGAEERGTILFPNDPKRRVEIIWRDKKKYARPEWVRIPDESRWTAFGLRVGMPIAELQKLNGKPFVFSGFEWDYGGFVTNWRAGAAATLGGKACSVTVRLDPVYPENPTKADEAAMEATGGDIEVTSDSPHVKRLKPRISEITVSYR